MPNQLCLVTDRFSGDRAAYLELVDRAISGGVDMVQLREKEAPPPYGQGRSGRELYELARELRALCLTRRVPFVVNDRLDLAMAVEADGVHLGQSDLPLAVARRLWPSGRIFGISASTAAEAERGEADGATYVGAGAVFATPTKAEAAAGGLGELARIVEATRLPVIAIGGINLENAAGVLESGCAGLAVVSAIWKADDPRAAAAGFKRLLALRSGGRSR